MDRDWASRTTTGQPATTPRESYRSATMRKQPADVPESKANVAARSRRMALHVALAGVLATCALALAGCSGSKSSGEPAQPAVAGGPKNMSTGPEPKSIEGKYGGKLIAATISDPKTLNPILSQETSSTDVLNPVFDSLIT